MILKALAFAKLNLTLEVLGRRADGYHEIKSILQTIDLADRLEFLPATTLQVECDDPSLKGQANLVWQAAVDLARRGKVEPQARIHIEKHIPTSMGLGGGSSDAACALMALNRLWALDLPVDDLAEVAEGLGSDVPYFLWGSTALVQGRGEQVAPLPPLPSLPVTLVCPGATLPNKTATMFGCLTPAHYSDGGVTRRMIEILLGDQSVGQAAGGAVHNVFEQIAAQAFLDLAWLQQVLSDLSPGRFHLSGAGPALFAFPSGEDEFRSVSAALQRYGIGVYLVRTVTTGQASPDDPLRP